MPANDRDSDDARTADRDNSRDRKPAKGSHSKIAAREPAPAESTPEAQEAYQRIIADKEAARKARSRRRK